MNTKSLRHFFSGDMDTGNSQHLYLDSAATSQKLKKVVEVTDHYYLNQTANVHRSSHQGAVKVTEKFELVRRHAQKFIGARSHKEIIWTKGATESINLVANCLAESHFKPGDEIVVSNLEHHANIVPWQQIALKYGCKLNVMPIDEKGVLKLKESLALITSKTAMVAVGHVSNALGNINPIKQIVEVAKAVGALTIVDGTQAISHMPVDVQQLDCDFYVFSGHKMYGPTGIGVLYGRQALLEAMPPYQVGGEMIEKVSFEYTSFQKPPLKFEAGTPNIAGVLGLGVAFEFIQQHREAITEIEDALRLKLIAELSNVPRVTLVGDRLQGICLQSFIVEGIDHYDLAVLLDKQNIALRVGHHCAMPLMEALDIEGTIRVSLACYNTLQEIDVFIQALKKGIELLVRMPHEVDDGTNIQEHSNLSLNTQPIALAIRRAKSWDETYRQLMLAGKGLTRLGADDKTAETEVHGCESQVWIKCSIEEQVLKLEGDSGSKIVRGLLAVIFEIFKGKSPSWVASFDLADYLEDLGLARHLSQSRGNGLSEVVKKITRFCESK